MQGPGHCRSCHTARAITPQERALDERGAPLPAAGGQSIDGWIAVSLRGNPADGLGSWSKQDIVTTLRSARNPGTAVIGSAMSDMVVHSTQQFLSDDDLNAVAAYLKSSAARSRKRLVIQARSRHRTRARGRSGSRSRRATLRVDTIAPPVTRTSGLGNTGVFPKIAGNSTVLEVDPTSIIHLISAR